MDHPKCTILEDDTIVLDAVCHIYFKESLFEDVICENSSSCSFESIKQYSQCVEIEINPISFEGSLVKKY